MNFKYPIYDTIGKQYNTHRAADPYLVSRHLHHLNPKPNGQFLEIGCGTGNYTNALHAEGLNMIGIDPSEVMLESARKSNSENEWRYGKAEDTRLEYNGVEGIIAQLTIHHWDDLVAGFSEMKRVLKEGCRIVIFHSTPEQMQGYWLNHYFPDMMQKSWEKMHSMEVIERALSAAGFTVIEIENYFVKPDLADLFLYSGKFQPERYFDEKLRAGISSFSSIVSETELNQGLKMLRSDIDSGEISRVMHDFENDLGDYLFIVCE